MADNLPHTAHESINGEVQIPLFEFFISLKQHGFLVTPAQITDSHSVIARYANTVKTEADLCDYLSPLFSNSEEEQAKFKEIFERHFHLNTPVHALEYGATVKEEPAIETKDEDHQKTTLHVKKHWWKYVSGIATLAILIFFLWPSTPPPPPRNQIYLRSNHEGLSGTYSDAFKTNINEKFEVFPEINDRQGDSIYQVKLIAGYDWGDNSGIDSSGTHLYSKKGIYQLTAEVKVLYNGEYQYSDTIQKTVRVCDENISLYIEHSLSSDSVRIGENVRFSARVTGPQPDSIKWLGGRQGPGVGNIFQTSFDTEKQQQITCVAIYDSLGGPCTVEKTINLMVYDPNKPIISATVYKAANANPIELKKKVKPLWFIGIGSLFLLSFAGILFIEKWKRRVKEINADKLEDTERKYNELVSAFSGKKPPFDLPFRNKNHLAATEQGLNEVAWQMRRRIDDETTYLHLPKTIQQSIRHAGFFFPVKVPRTQQSEYLVLIDENTVNNQQVKLFEFMVDLWRKQNVFVEKFYYRREPAICYNVFEPNGISLEKLNQKFPKHILLILGNASQLIYDSYPVFDPAYLQVIRHWRYKAIITPTPVPDWGFNEKKVLREELLVLPADVYGQLMLMQELFSGNIAEITDLHEFRDQYYKVDSVDFEETDELITYCETAAWARVSKKEPSENILFQWIAALALYPRIRWEIILAVGHAILEKYGKPEELNFSNLLRIVRIKWMSEGKFPDYTRLELLKFLKIDNEVIARETILALLKEIPPHEITADHFVYEEMEIQRILNEFNLYAYDPVKYAAYQESKEIFEKLWKEKKILDSPAKAYLKNENKEWNTLVNKAADRKGNAEEKENIPLEEYWEDTPDDTKKTKDVKLWIGFVVSLLFLGSILGLLFLTVLNFLNTDSFAALTYKKEIQRKIAFTLIDSGNSITADNALVRIDTTDVALKKDSTVSIELPVNDSFKIITVSVNGEQLFDSSINLNHDAYTIFLSAKPVDKSIKATIYINNSCAQAIYDYRRNISDAYEKIIITDSIVNTNANQNARTTPETVCLNHIAFGKRIEQEIIERIIENFRKSGIDLKISTEPNYLVAENEIAIYYAEAISPDPVKKVNVHIQLSDESLLASAKAFSAKLEAAGYQVTAIDVANYNNNSQVNYYDKSLIEQARDIQRLYNSYFPGLTIPAKLLSSRGNANVENRIDIWIRKLEDGNTLPVRLNSYGKKVYELKEMLLKAGYKNIVQNSEFDKATEEAVKDFQLKNNLAVDGIAGLQFWDVLTRYINAGKENTTATTQTIKDTISPPNEPEPQVKAPIKSPASVATREIGYMENPDGSNKTKYGQWYGMDAVPWSAIFVSWVYDQSGRPLSGVQTSKGFSSFSTALNYYKKMDRLTEKPEPGDIVIITSSSENSYTGGIFIEWTMGSKKFTMIAGNSNEKGGREGNSVVSQSISFNPKTTYFVRVLNKDLEY